MTTSCGPSIMPEAVIKDAGAVPAQKDDDLIQARELALVQELMADHINRLMPGPASLAGRYQVQTGGSLLRARLALASGRSFGCSRQYRIAAAAACELIHNASLVHDDLLDRDETRRGVASVWKRFGGGVALCAGDLLLCAAFGVAAILDDSAEARLLNQHIASMTGRVIVGQSMEMAYPSDQSSPRLRAYLQTTKEKTVPLIELPLITCAIAGGADQSTQDCIRQLASAIGLSYQIIDDLDDLSSSRSVLHPFHAWHHHRPGRQDDSGQRIRRAIRHATAALNRGKRLHRQLEAKVTTSLAPTLDPLLRKLEERASAHNQLGQFAGEPAAHDNTVTG